jgi:hypothetical protein
MPRSGQQQCLEGSLASCGHIYSRHGLHSLPRLGLGKRVVHQQLVGSVDGPTPASSFISAQEVLYVSASSLSNKQESELDGNHLIVLCTLSDHDLRIDTHALVDCGCTGYSFMNDKFARQHNFPHYQLKTPKTVEVIDGQPISSGDITKYVHIDCTIGDHDEKLIAYVASIGYYPLILGILWLKKHDVNINFPKMDIQFPSPNCLAHQSKVTLTPIKGITTIQNNKICAISATSFRRIINNVNNRYFKVE